ncbi:hypothetical protein CFE70_002982 [Pyrenophora teres f. teres 0-1]
MGREGTEKHREFVLSISISTSITSKFDGYKAIPISAPPAVAPVPAIIQSTATATYTTWLFENTTTLCTSPNLALANLEAAFESSFENRLEVQVLMANLWSG